MKKRADNTKSAMFMETNPTECPFREFRDNELGIEYWGQGPAQFRMSLTTKSTTKPSQDYVWVDDQTQPLPRSVRNYLHGWMRAEELASSRWDAEVVIFEETNAGKMSVIDMQFSHAQVLLRSSFCRKVLSACYMLERTESLTVEHTWENFSFSFGPEGWRPKYHIYSPGVKAGGGLQHRPGFSKCGCYLVRLYYLGAWRCVWVSDQVPVDATDSPLLPLSPLLTPAPAVKPKQIPDLATSGFVQLWPLLLCKSTPPEHLDRFSTGQSTVSHVNYKTKALLKLAAPDMNSDEDADEVDDESMLELDILHALTGSMSLLYSGYNSEKIWKLLTSEVQMFIWDDDDETLASTIKTKSTKKPMNKESIVVKRSMVSALVRETKDEPTYTLPGMTPAHEMSVIVTMLRDLPLRKPLPEPEVALWKTYRWVDWARHHGLYAAYDCPRHRFIKISGLLKLSHAPHLLDVQSTESITFCFREEHEKQSKKGHKDNTRSTTVVPHNTTQQKEELREWVQYDSIYRLIKHINILYYPSMFQFTTTGNNPPLRNPSKAPLNKALDIPALKSAPLYLQIDGPEEIKLRLSLNVLHPRILANSGVPLMEYIEPSYLILEVFEWFKDVEVPRAKAFVKTRGYSSVETTLKPGRHFCRLWVHSRMNWHVGVLSESTVLLGSRDTIQCASVRECPWGAKFLAFLGASFNNWIRVSRSNSHIIIADREFFASYQPDLYWDPQVVGYNKSYVHWMFRQALQSMLSKRLTMIEYHTACNVLRRYFMDPDFGLPPKPVPKMTLREMIASDPCDCVMPEVEEVEGLEEMLEEQMLTGSSDEEGNDLISPDILEQLLSKPTPPAVSQVCELATEDLSCGILKHEREKELRKHEAATFIQAHWRGAWARKCLRTHVIVTSDIIKMMMENAFGNIEALQILMNEFFSLYPGAKYAYSVASALSGIYGLYQHYGTAPMTSKCKWVPYFQGVFICHEPVKVHFDIQSSLPYSTVAVYNNDNGIQMPQAYNAHVTFHFQPNINGYTVIGHGTVNNRYSSYSDVHWQLTVLSSIEHVFHICDNPVNDVCTILPLAPSTKLRLEEIYIPNRRCILGGMVISVTKNDSVSFRATSTSPELELEAVLRTTNEEGVVKEIARCAGKGEICWSYVRLKAPSDYQVAAKKSGSHASLSMNKEYSGARPVLKKRTTNVSIKPRSTTRIVNSKPAPLEPKQYVIEVIAPHGWPLTLDQWNRVDVIRNSLVPPKIEATPKKCVKEKGGSAKDKTQSPEQKLPSAFTPHAPQLDDAYVILECATAVGGGATPKRNDGRDMLFAAARMSWEAKEHGRNLRGAKFRKEFRDEFLIPTPVVAVTATESVVTSHTEFQGDGMFEFETDEYTRETELQGPTPVTESGMIEVVEEEEETKYIMMPEQLRDKLTPLHFVELCTKEMVDHPVLMTSDIAEAAKKERHAHIDGALEHMRQLQLYNETFVLGRQKKRCMLLEALSVDAVWRPELAQVLQERDEAVTREALERSLSATKKKQEAKKK